MNVRIQEMMTELMRDVFEAQVNPQPILELKFDDAAPAADEVDEYTIEVKSTTVEGKVKTYSASKLSAARDRNVQLLNIALAEFAAAQDDTKRAAIRKMIDAILNTF